MASSKPIDGVLCGGTTIKMLKNLLVIWLDSNITETNIDCCNTITQLQRVVNTINIFKDSSQCMAFLEDMDDEKVCIVISGSLGQRIMPRIHQMSQVDSIFIFCCNKKYHEQWAEEWSKVKGVFTEITPICDALKKAALGCEQNATSFSLLATNGDLSNTNLNKLNPMFIYSQVLKEILLDIEFENQHYMELIDYCREVLGDNEAELKNLKKFERKYRDQTSISWDISECFLYPILNHALRVMDLNVIIRLGFYIGDIHRQIKQLHKKQFTSKHSEKIFTVYRGKGMYKEKFDNMQKTLGGFISFNNFLSTNKKKQISLDFARHALSNPNMVGVLFIMTVNPSKSRTSFATINKAAHSDAEDEIIFAMHTIFRIQQIQSLDENSRLFQVELELTGKNDEELRALTKHIRKQTFPNSPGWFRLGEVLAKMNQFDKAQQVYEILLKQKTEEVQKAPLYHQLGTLKDDQGEYEEAIRFYEKAIEIYKETRSPNDPEFGMFYNNIGLVYGQMNEYTKALEYYENHLKSNNNHILRIILFWLNPIVTSVKFTSIWMNTQKHFHITKNHSIFNENHFLHIILICVFLTTISVWYILAWVNM